MCGLLCCKNQRTKRIDKWTKTVAIGYIFRTLMIQLFATTFSHLTFFCTQQQTNILLRTINLMFIFISTKNRKIKRKTCKQNERNWNFVSCYWNEMSNLRKYLLFSLLLLLCVYRNSMFHFQFVYDHISLSCWAFKIASSHWKRL